MWTALDGVGWVILFSERAVLSILASGDELSIDGMRSLRQAWRLFIERTAYFRMTLRIDHDHNSY